jgi:protein-S-isoprenylcysteine O-methyltransferase Ste14
MLTEIVAALILLICLLCFAAVNLHNILIVHKRRGNIKIYAETERPSGFAVYVAGVGTLVHFLGVLVYLSLTFTGLISSFYGSVFYVQFPLMIYVQVSGLILVCIGYFLFIWSVVTRGVFAVSWSMPENQKLVTWGPYKHVRHPSYLAYFLMFIGLFFLWTNPLTLFPFFAIPGYYRVTSQEEKLLAQRFGKEYLEYQKRTGQFIPRFR